MPLINVFISQPLSHHVFCPLLPLITCIVLSVNCFTVHAIPATVQSCSILFTAMFINGDIDREWKIETYIKFKSKAGEAMANSL